MGKAFCTIISQNGEIMCLGCKKRCEKIRDESDTFVCSCFFLPKVVSTFSLILVPSKSLSPSSTVSRASRTRQSFKQLKLRLTHWFWYQLTMSFHMNFRLGTVNYERLKLSVIDRSLAVRLESLPNLSRHRPLLRELQELDKVSS